MAAALNGMHLNYVWNKYHSLRTEPGAFAAAANDDLVRVFGPDSSFATALCGVLDAGTGDLRLAAAGGPPALLFRAGRDPNWLHAHGIPLGVTVGSAYTETTTILEPGDRLILFTDGAFEIHNAVKEELGMDGLLRMLQSFGYPRRDLHLERLEEELLKYSNAIRLQDDLTIILLEYGT